MELIQQLSIERWRSKGEVMSNYLQYTNKSTLIDHLVLQMFSEIQNDYNNGEIKTEKELFYRLKEAIQQLQSTLNRPTFKPRYASNLPILEDYHEMIDELVNDIYYLFSDCESINQSLTQSFTEQEEKRTTYKNEIRYLTHKINKLKEKITPTLSNQYRIVSNSFLEEERQTSIGKTLAYINQSDGVLMLPFTTSVSYNDLLSVEVLERSNGVPGNTHVADYLNGEIYYDGQTNLQLDLRSMIDGNVDTWFEYEGFKISDSVYERCDGFGFNYDEGLSWIIEEDGLILRLKLKLENPQFCNWLSLTPYLSEQKGVKASYLTRCFLSDEAGNNQEINQAQLFEETIVLTFNPQVISTIILEFDQQHQYEVQVGHQAYFKVNSSNYNVFNTLNVEESRRYNGPLPSVQYLGLSFEPKTKTFSQPSTERISHLSNEEFTKKSLFQAMPDLEQAKSQLELINAYRYSIGIKDVTLAYYNFQDQGEYISQVFETEDAISSVTLEAVEFIPEGIGEGYGIQYFLNFNQGEQWYPIVPVSRSYQGICQYEINNGNLDRYLRPSRKNESQGILTLFETINRVQIKIVLSKPENAEIQTPMVYDYRLKITTDGDYFDY